MKPLFTINSILLLLLLVFSNSIYAQNLFTNPSFDPPYASPSPVPAPGNAPLGWTNTGGWVGTEVTGGIGELNSSSLDLVAGAPGDLIEETAISTVIGRTYQVSVYALLPFAFPSTGFPGTPGTDDLLFYLDGVPFGVPGVFTLNDTWEYFTVSFTATKTSYAIGFGLSTATGVSLLLDEASCLTSLVLNPQMDGGTPMPAVPPPTVMGAYGDAPSWTSTGSITTASSLTVLPHPASLPATGNVYSQSIGAGTLTADYVYQSISGLTVGKTYDVSFDAYQVAGSFGIQVGIYAPAATSLIYNNEFTFAAATTWYSKSFSFTATETTHEIRFSGGSGTTVLFDNVEMQPNDPPTATSATITGTLLNGDVLGNSWTYADTEGDAAGTHTYQWYRADNSTGLNRAAISGATSSTYTLTSSDVGKYIDYEVTPVAATGTSPGTAATSAVVGPVVADAAPSFSGASGIAGAPNEVGTTFTASNSTFTTDNTPSNEGTHIYQWYRDADGVAGGEIIISGATSSTYTATGDDLNYWLGCIITPVATTGTSPGTPAAIAFTSGKITSSTAGIPSLVSPSNGATNISLTPTFTWAANTDPLGIYPAETLYDLQVATDAFFSNIVHSTTGAGWALSEGPISTTLSLNTKYYWRVRAYGSGYSPWSTIWSFTTTAVTTPTIAYPTGGATVYTASPTIYWYAATYAPSATFTLDVATDAGFTSPIAGSPFSGLTTTYKTLSGLTPGSTYYIKVTMVQGAISAVSSTESFVVDNSAGGVVVPIPSYPTGGVTVYTLTPTLYWYLGSYSTGLTYFVEVSTSPGFGTTVYTASSLSELYTTTSTLTAGTTYYWRVKSYNGSIYSAWSTTASFVTSSTTTTTPVTPIPSWPVGGATVYATSTTLYWYLGSYATGLTYTVQIATDAGFSSIVYTNSGIANLYESVTGLSTGTTYYWRVNSTDGITTSSWSTTATFVTSTTASGSVSTPILTYPTGGVTVYTTSPTLYWYILTSGAGITYEIKYSLYPDLSLATTVSGISTTSYTLSGLTNGTTYYWSARSYNGSVYSAWASAASFTVVPSPSSPVIVPLAGSPVGGITIDTESPEVSWFLPTSSGSLAYDIQLSKSEDFADAIEYNNVKSTSLVSNDLEKGEKYYWRVRSRDNGNHASEYSATESFVLPGGVTGVEEIGTIPNKFELDQNYPNPFNPSTIFEYSLPKAAHVTFKIYDLLGREVATLVNEEQNAGIFRLKWDGTNEYGSKVSSGTYIYRITAGEFIKVKKMVLLK